MTPPTCRPGPTIEASAVLTVDYARLGVRPGDRLLDLGCGFGRHAYQAARLGAEVVASTPAPTRSARCPTPSGPWSTPGSSTPTEPGRRGPGRRPRPAVRRRQPSTGSSPRRCSSTSPTTSAAMAELARVLRPGGTMAVTVPRCGPEVVNWALSDEYHDVPGGHVRIYRRSQLVDRLERTGLRTGGQPPRPRPARPLLVAALPGRARPTTRHPAVAAYHRLLVWDIEKAPKVTRYAERVLNPLVGKSLVVYLEKPGARRRRDRPGAPTRRPRRRRCQEAGVRPIPEVPGPDVAPSRCWPRPVDRRAAAPGRDDPVVPGGHCDPWNHVEAAMALTVAGLDDEADRAYQWLVDTQLPDGSWFNYYLATGIEDPRLDTNVCAYLATGAWHRYVSTGDLDGPREAVAHGRGRASTSCCAGSGRRRHPVVARSLGLPRGVRPAHRLVVDLPQPALRHRLRRAPGPRAARLGAGRRPAGPRRGPRARRVRPEGGVRHGLVLPGAVRRAHRRGGPSPDRRSRGRPS